MHKGGDRDSCGSSEFNIHRINNFGRVLRDKIVNHIKANKLMMVEQHDLSQTSLSDQLD